MGGENDLLLGVHQQRGQWVRHQWVSFRVCGDIDMLLKSKALKTGYNISCKRVIKIIHMNIKIS